MQISLCGREISKQILKKAHSHRKCQVEIRIWGEGEKTGKRGGGEKSHPDFFYSSLQRIFQECQWKVLHTCKFSRPGNFFDSSCKRGCALAAMLGSTETNQGDERGGDTPGPKESTERSMEERIKVWQISSSSLVENMAAIA